MEQVNLIAETIEDTKIKYQGMYQMCFLLGIVPILGVLAMALAIGVPKVPIALVSGIRILLAISLIIGYYVIYKREVKYSNKYYLSLLDTWGFTLNIGKEKS